MAITEQIIETRPSADIPNFFEWDSQQKAISGEQSWESKIEGCSIPGFSFNYSTSDDGLIVTVNFVYDNFTVMNSFKDFINISKLNGEAGFYYNNYLILPVFSLLNTPSTFSITSVYEFPDELDIAAFSGLLHDPTIVDLVVLSNKFTVINNFTDTEEYTNYAISSALADLTVRDLVGTKTVTYADGLYVPE